MIINLLIFHMTPFQHLKQGIMLPSSLFPQATHPCSRTLCHRLERLHQPTACLRIWSCLFTAFLGATPNLN